MVFFFQPNDDRVLIYMGRDKWENEELLKYGWDEDIWFHVDGLSSAHVYVRMWPGAGVDELPESVLIDCAQLVKQNSIEGCKKNNVKICYTPFANLRKGGDMDVGQVGFHDQRKVRYITVEKRDNAIVNRLNRTKSERNPDLAAEREQHIKALAREKKSVLKQTQRSQREMELQQKEEQERNSYDRIFNSDNMRTNKDFGSGTIEDARRFEEDFM
eukprot:GILJ01001193.1.p1 GENE.GILJ01001193.1~~GILJ01001193.1.p1  ORF type:complete len:215 (+),score=39.55 GILJ01001193.1:49-693(+)